MTTRPPTHVVVDGSNIATEGRSMPSLTQLNEAVLAYRAEHPHVTITVVVDATFGHRIARSEMAEFDAAVSNNELVAPPAGAVGRGDAFVLGIANKANATVLSNDSFQEFHGQYTWLFDEGRLVGGKPVPHVGWVFVERTPVRGPVSRKAVRESKHTPTAADARRRGRGRAAAPAEAVTDGVAKKASRQASMPMPVPTTPPPGRAVPNDGVNELMPFLEFVERHPVGTSVNAVVDSYSSHGAYVRVGDVKGYVPLRLMGDPPPRSAREVVKVGDAVTLVVASFAPARRSIDLSMPQVPMVAGSAGEVAVEAVVDAVAPAPAPTRRGRGRATDAVSAPVAAPAETPARKRASRSAAGGRVAATATATDALPSMQAAEHAPVKKGAAKKTASTKATDVPAKQAPAKQAPASKQAPAKQAPAKKGAAKKTATAKATDVPAKQAPAKQPSVTKQRSAAKQARAAKQAPAATKAPAKKAAAARSTPETAAAGPAAAKQPSRRRRATAPETAPKTAPETAPETR
jgi:hypothetical protein